MSAIDAGVRIVSVKTDVVQKREEGRGDCNDDELDQHGNNWVSAGCEVLMAYCICLTVHFSVSLCSFICKRSQFSRASHREVAQVSIRVLCKECFQHVLGISNTYSAGSASDIATMSVPDPTSSSSCSSSENPDH